MANDDKRIVEVYVKAPHGQDAGVFEYCTGYLAGRDAQGRGLVLTSHHVFEKGCVSVEVRFRDASTEAQDLRCEVVLDLHPRYGYDVAILCVLDALPTDITSQDLDLDSQARLDRPASAYGYPQLTKEPRRNASGRRDLILARGRIGPLQRGSKTLAMACDRALKYEDGWKGISGGPVFCDDRLFGIIAQHDPVFTTATLNVVPMCLLLECDDFREHFYHGEPTHEERARAIKQAIRDEVATIEKQEHRDRLITALGESLFGKRDARLKKDRNALFDDVANHLARGPLRRNPHLCVEAGKRMKEAGYEELAEVIAGILKWILPREIDRNELAHVSKQLRDGLALLTLPFNMHHTVENAFSAHQRLPAVFHKVDSRQIRGKVALVCERPVPVDRKTETLAVDILKELCRGFEAHQNLKAQGPGKVIGHHLQALDGVLDTLITPEVEGRTPYCIVSPLDNQDDRNLWREAVALINADRFRLWFAELSIENAGIRSETYCLEVLNKWFD